ncbi:hypothetical protein EJB05_00595 [Eragrostis curvula]|uniref:Peptidase M20 dimerisation domain-containing protein n=1 Tax=Eragrostis curvula TaxID=38414 RepID=A0A5J9WM45_9POAL|nr:hypothetical protein EJB05_00595 [Eragrostis curvula]
MPPTHVSRLLLLLACLVAASDAAGHDDAAARRTMEAFAGFPSTDDGESPFSVDSEGLQRQIDELASFSDSPAPSVTRVLYSDKDVQARRYIKGIMNQLGLSVREDAVGNIFGRWEGSESGLGAVATGSHVDAIPFSGKYDGVVGVLGALEAISMLKRSGFQPKKSLEVIMFTSEEPTRFGISCLGSRLMAGIEELAQSLIKVVDNQNVSFLEAASSAGYKMHPEDLHSVFLKKDDYSAFIELHIEQGPILEKEGIPIGIVTAIAAPASIKVEFEGNGGHAGAVLMPARNDAGLAAAELALAVEKHVLDSGSIDTVGTVGILQLHPGAINSIPSKSHIEIGRILFPSKQDVIFDRNMAIFQQTRNFLHTDVRDIDEKRRNDVIEKVRQSAAEISKKRGVVLSEFQIINQDPPAQSDKSVIDAMEFAVKQLNLEYKLMISRAYHDSLFMARISPMGMIFIPCYKGYSHKPEEYASPEDMANGVKVLALAMAKLSLE